MPLLKSAAATCPEKLEAAIATPARREGIGESLGSSCGSETDGARGDPLSSAVKQQTGLGYTAIGEHALNARPC